mmetsp:Transcript_56051/g.131363  ORF Transcript_56051/g.131363 Transcript_56051/m.131363 type:complete len:258 (-) Transcript_56051:230-1003(-)
MIDPQQQKLQSVVMGQMPGAGNQQQQQPAAGSLQFMDSSSYGNYAQQPQAGGGPGYYSQPTDFSGTIGGGAGATNFDDEPSLLEELGIDFHKIYERTVSVLNPMKKVTKDMLYSIGHDGQQSADSDMAGPLIIGLMLGGAMLLRGKVQFGYIYGVSMVGCFSLWLVMTLMSERGIDLWQTASILGYCLLPMVLLAFFSVFFSGTGAIMSILTVMTVIWCTMRSSDMMVIAMDVHNEKALVAYPIGLFYACFALISVF